MSRSEPRICSFSATLGVHVQTALPSGWWESRRNVYYRFPQRLEAMRNSAALAARKSNFGSFDFDLTPDRRIDALKRNMKGDALERFRHLLSGKRESARLSPQDDSPESAKPQNRFRSPD